MKKKISNALNSSKNIFLKVVKLINKNKKKIVIVSSVFLVVFISVFSFINLRYPTKINAYIAHVINKGEPANSAFNSVAFYDVVIDAYNNENNTTLPYTTNLTDEQLGTIKSVKADDLYIKSIAGIEKLTSLISLNIYRAELSDDIDFSHNKKLTDLTLTYSSLGSNINLSQNSELVNLNMQGSGLEHIELENNKNLVNLDLAWTYVNTLNLSENKKLKKLDLSRPSQIFDDSERFTNIDLTNNTELTDLDLSGNLLTSIDLTNNTKLTNVDLRSNNLTSIDLSNNTSLVDLNLRNNKITNIDVSKNTSLTHLKLESNHITSIDLSKNILLTELGLGSNNLSNINLEQNNNLNKLYLDNLNLNDEDINEINLSRHSNLTNLDLSSNNLTSIDLSKNTSLTELMLYGNPLNFNCYVKYGEKITSSTIKLPENSEKFYFLYDEIDNNTITYDDLHNPTSVHNFNDKFIKQLSIGKKNISLYMNYVEESSSSKLNMNLSGTINVYNFSSAKYKINNDEKYIYTKNDTDNNTILSNITLEGIEGKIEDNKLVLYDGSTIVDEYKLVHYNSTKYVLTKDYIYVGDKEFKNDDITIVNGTINVTNDKVEIKYNNEVLDEYKLLKCSSSKYDLSKEYIYLGTDDFDKENINLVNLTISTDDNTINIKYGDNIIKSYKLVKVSSSKYDLTKDNIKISAKEELDMENIKVTNGTKEYSNNKLYIKYNDDILKVYTVSKRAKGDINNDNKVTVADVALLYRHVRKTKVIEDNETLEISDLTGDGEITVADVAMLYRYVRGNITEL